MSLLKKIEKGVRARPYFLALYGMPGVGKTTLAADFEKPLFADVEKGSGHLNVDRISEIHTYQDIMGLIADLNQDQRGYKTFVIDTADALERLIKDRVCQDTGKKNIEEIGYGKGWVFAEKYWEELVHSLQQLREKMNVILIAHTQIERVNDPTQPVPYDQFSMKLHKRASNVIQEAVDAILFCAYEVYVKTNEGNSKGKAIGDGKRIMFTSAIPGHVAKNRFGMPSKIDMTYAAFAAAASPDAPGKTQELYKKIKNDITSIPSADGKARAKATLEEQKTDLASLLALDKKVQTAIGV